MPTAPPALPSRPPRPRVGRAPPTPPGMGSSLDAARVSPQPSVFSAQPEGAGYPRDAQSILAASGLGAAARDKEFHAGGGISSAWSASVNSTSPAIGLSSAGGSSSSTQVPSPATTGESWRPGPAAEQPISARRSPRHPLLSQGGSSSTVPASGTQPLARPQRRSSQPSVAGQLGAPVTWLFKPQDEEHRLRNDGAGSGHLKGRKANLARIREIQGRGGE